MNENELIVDFTMDDLPNDILRDIYQYWLNMKGDRPMASRADLNPADIVRLLPYIGLIDVERETGRYKIRLLGTETVKAMGVDVTGKYLDELPDAERALKEKYDWLVKEKRPYFIFDKLKWSRKTYLEYYALAFPLSSNGTDVDILMYCIYYQFPSEARTEIYNLSA